MSSRIIAGPIVSLASSRHRIEPTWCERAGDRDIAVTREPVPARLGDREATLSLTSRREPFARAVGC